MSHCKQKHSNGLQKFLVFLFSVFLLRTLILLLVLAAILSTIYDVVKTKKDRTNTFSMDQIQTEAEKPISTHLFYTFSDYFRFQKRNSKFSSHFLYTQTVNSCLVVKNPERMVCWSV